MEMRAAKRNMRDLLHNAWPYGVLAVVMTVALVPVFWVALSSFKSSGDILAIPPRFFAQQYTLRHYFDAFVTRQAGGAFVNSLVIALSTVCVCLIIGTTAAYSFARSRRPWAQRLMTLILAGRMLPGIALCIPLYTLMRHAGLLNTRFSLILAYISFNLPFTIYMMSGFISQIPYEIEESGSIDGCTTLQNLFRLVLPLITTGLGATSIFIFLQSWNEFLYAVIFMSNQAKRTIPVVVVSFNTGLDVYWGEMFAVMSVALIPAFLFSIFAQKQLVSGIVGGAVKG